MNRLKRINTGYADALQIGCGLIADHAPWQRGVVAKGLLIEKIAPATDRLSERHINRQKIQQAGNRLFSGG